MFTSNEIQPDIPTNSFGLLFSPFIGLNGLQKPFAPKFYSLIALENNIGPNSGGRTEIWLRVNIPSVWLTFLTFLAEEIKNK